MSLYFRKQQTGEELNVGNRAGWSELYELAQCFGWEPAGTVRTPQQHNLPEDHPEYFATYFTNDFQFFTREDAANLAKALKLAGDHAYVGSVQQELYKYVEFFESGDILIL